jgi:hypothetical protein
MSLIQNQSNPLSFSGSPGQLKNDELRGSQFPSHHPMRYNRLLVLILLMVTNHNKSATELQQLDIDDFYHLGFRQGYSILAEGD